MALCTRYWSLIQETAATHNLDPILVEAVVVQESSGNTDAFRFEPDFWNRYLKGRPEHVGVNPRRVSSSYGLMQIMFPVARERGYPVALPPEALFVPEVGLTWGCTHLAYLLTWARRFDIPTDQALLAALASYNGGRGGNHPINDTPLRNARYAHEVMIKAAILVSEHAHPPVK